MKPFKGKDEESDRPLIPMPWSLETPFISPANLDGTSFVHSVDATELGVHLKAKKNRLDVLYSSPPMELFTGSVPWRLIWKYR